jgi:hypothetical protein
VAALLVPARQCIAELSQAERWRLCPTICLSRPCLPVCLPRQVAGTGPEGRVTKGDVLTYLDALSAAGPGTIGEDVAHDVPTTGGPACLSAWASICLLACLLRLQLLPVSGAAYVHVPRLK